MEFTWVSCFKWFFVSRYFFILLMEEAYIFQYHWVFEVMEVLKRVLFAFPYC